MTRAPRSRRLILVGAVAVLGLAACGSDTTARPDTTGTAVASPSTDGAPSTTDRPAVIVLGGQSGAAGAPMAQPSAEADSRDAMVADDMKMFPTNIVYEYQGTPPDLPAAATAWYFPADQRASTEQVAALAAALGVGGDVVQLPADQGGGWMVGAADYSGPTVNVGTDAMQSWWYNGAPTPSVAPCYDIDPPADDVDAPDAGGGVDAMDGAAESPMIAEPGTDSDVVTSDVPADTKPDTVPVDSEPVECVEYTPEGVPTAEEAEQLATELFTKIGLDLSSYELETHADEWNAGVTAYLVLDGVRTQATVYVGFGEHGALNWAGGFLGTPQRGDDYPLIGVLGGVDRLNEQAAMWRTDPAAMTRGAAVDAATSDMVDGGPADDAGDVAPLPADPEPRPIDSGSGDGSDGSEGIVEGEVPEPETIVITFTDARPSLEMQWAPDGTVWLLPGYQFDATDEGWYTVIAIEDQYLEQADPATDPLVVEPSTGAATPAAPAADCAASDVSAPAATAGDPVEVADVQWLVGLCLTDAQKAAEQFGSTVRVVREDGEDLAVTDDFNDRRVNVAVDGGVITEVVSIG